MTPMAVTLCVIQTCVQTCMVSAMRGHRMSKSQISVSMSVTCFRVDITVALRAATITLSQNLSRKTHKYGQKHASHVFDGRFGVLTILTKKFWTATISQAFVAVLSLLCVDR